MGGPHVACVEAEPRHPVEQGAGPGRQQDPVAGGELAQGLTPGDQLVDLRGEVVLDGDEGGGEVLKAGSGPGSRASR